MTFQVRNFEELVKSQLAGLSEHDRSLAEKRLGLYAQMRAAYAQIHSGDLEKLASDLMELNRTIERVEATHRAPPNWIERKLEELEPRIALVRASTEKLKLKYGFLAVVATTAADLLKPFFEFTKPIMAISLVLGLACVIAARFLRPLTKSLHGGAIVCAIFFVCSSGWWVAQRVIPGAQAKGALVESVPGLAKVQAGILALLNEIKGETNRVGNILEETAKREILRNQEQELRERERVESLRQKIAAAGYAIDSKGFAAAVLDNSDYLPLFQTLKVELTEDALRSKIRETPVSRMSAVGSSLKKLAIDYPFTRDILRDLRAFSVRMDPSEISYYNLVSPKGRAAACDLQSYMMKIDARLLERACAERSDYMFNAAYKIFLEFPLK